MALDEEDVRRIVREELRRLMMEAISLLPYVDGEDRGRSSQIAGVPSDYSERDFVEWEGE